MVDVKFLLCLCLDETDFRLGKWGGERKLHTCLFVFGRRHMLEVMLGKTLTVEERFQQADWWPVVFAPRKIIPRSPPPSCSNGHSVIVSTENAVIKSKTPPLVF